MPLFTWWVVVVGISAFVLLAFACWALHKISPVGMRLCVRVSPWAVSVSIEMDGRAHESTLDAGRADTRFRGSAS
jgi:hypothetical protein